MLSRRLFYPFLSLVLSVSAVTSVAQNHEWELKKNKNGIKVYVKKVDGSGFDAFRVQMEEKATMKEMEYILSHLDEYKHIFPDTKEIKILDRGKDWLIQYSINDAPWPADDRDGVYKMQFIYNQKSGGFHTEGRSIPDYLPRKESIVRVTQSLAYWRVNPTENGKVSIEYEVHAEPGGNIPEWIVNTAITEVPYSTFVNLRDVLKDN